MANPAVQTALCSCAFGTTPASLTVTSQQTVFIGGMPAATILDGTPSNLPTFGTCSNPSNPAVAAATAAAMGVLTPQPCLPVCVSWAPGSSTVTVCKRPALNSTSNLTCVYGGMIRINFTPAMQVNIP